ncbi:MAG: DUF1028 domain-containing protein [Betaproteobacteria bacterium]|nr:DUF1028 domain-containing protein [Betaproteobacteria bacterium]
MTFSICGRCAKTGMVGVAITTSSICVGSRCPWARANVGAVATQNVTLPSLGAATLDNIAGGTHCETAINGALEGDSFADYRQIIAIDAAGRGAVFAGAKTLGVNATAIGEDCVAAGNLLADAGLPLVMTRAFAARAVLNLPARLLCALEAGLHEGGGEAGEVHSAALLVADKQPWALVDLRVDWDDAAPLSALRRLWEAYEPQVQDYVTRALNPPVAPSYGVQGDE